MTTPETPKNESTSVITPDAMDSHMVEMVEKIMLGKIPNFILVVQGEEGLEMSIGGGAWQAYGLMRAAMLRIERAC